MKASLLVVSLLLVVSSSAQAINYKYKKASDFAPLNQFTSIEKFEQNYQSYIQDCLDNTGGGTGGMECYIDYAIWDRELNIYYKKVYKLLDKNERALLKKSQLTWIKERDQSIEFNSLLLDKKFAGKMGTMYSLIRSGDASDAIVPIIKQRALVLKRWFEYISS